MLICEDTFKADWLPGLADIASYEAQGYLVTPPILPDNLLEPALVAIESFLDRNESVLDPLARVSDLRCNRGAPYDHVGYLFHELAPVRRLILQSGIGAIAARLAHEEKIRLFHDRFLLKPCDSGESAAIGWHVDRAYWFACTSDSMLTAWVPFGNVGSESGALCVVPGSHRWEDARLMATAHRTDMDSLLGEATQGRSCATHTLCMQRGQVSFHHCRLIHGSRQNCSTDSRAALAVHLQPGDNRRREVILPDGRSLAHTNDILCRTGPDGLPDYTDPEIFPVLWEAQG